MSRRFVSISKSLIKDLEHALGRQTAHRELRWMRETLNSPPLYEDAESAGRRILREHRETLPDLATMVKRRIEGEPLQYILGKFGSVGIYDED